MLQSGLSGSGTADAAAASGAETTGAGSAAIGTNDGRDALFETATVFGVGFNACTRVLSVRAPSATSKAL
jgi:hypothetical protein